ncbi:MAG TPA: diguanylate cyclase [Thermoanaerobaculia bacterium]|jgi:diguanylate cyclase (GGDEF)-like protein
MRPRLLPRLHRALAGCLFLACAAAAGAAPAAPRTERGFPLIQVYEPTLRGTSPQSFDIARDPRGVLYVGNLGGVLVYDGAWWQLIPIGKALAAYALASDAAGRVAVGGTDEIGYLAPDAGGRLRYVSLVSLLPAGQRELGQILDVHPWGQGFAFLTTDRLLVWDGTRVVTAVTFPSGRPFAQTFLIGGTLYVWSRETGLARLAGTRLQPVPGGDIFRGRRMDRVLPADGGLLVSVRGEGLFLFRDGRAAPFAPEASKWAVAGHVVEGQRLPDGRWALGTVLGGLLLLRPDGTVDQIIDTTVGLPDNFVTGLVTDREGSLWVALNNGLVRLQVASPLSVLDRRSGIEGSVYVLARHQGHLWAGTSAGLFTTAPLAITGTGTGAGEAGSPAGPVRLRAVPGVPASGWSLLSMGDDLLVGTAFGLFQVRGLDARLVAGTDDLRTVYALAPSRMDPGRVWLGTENGLAAVRRDGAEWRFEGRAAGISGEIRTLVEKAGVVWCGRTVGRIAGWRIPSAGLAAAPAREVAGSDGMSLYRIAGRILVPAGGQVLRLDEAEGRLVKDPDLAALAGHGDFSFLAEDAAGNLWRSTLPPTVSLRQGAGWAPSPRTLVEVTAHDIEQILAEPDGVVWLATDKGLFRYEGATLGQAAALPAPRLSSLTADEGRVLFGGAPGMSPKAADLPPYLRHLRIEFAPLSFRAGLRYQTRLEPLDARWSEPTAEPFAELTRLPPGDYTFHVRTLGPNGETGPGTSWSFHVQPPWYKAAWALALWAALALLAVWTYARLRGRALHQRAARLETRVNEQTVELRSTVEELRRAHTDLATANSRLEELSLRDELTGIANRRRLQQALAEEWSHTRQPIAFVLLDLDSFKLLNDTRGHLAGDLALQAVASLLAAAAQRAGGLAARYGGEEFAVLLPGVGLPGAQQVAEQLRAAIEALAIPNEAAPLKRITASFGVVALSPAPGQTPEGLVEAADLALYRAKAEGKNRVCAGGVR